MNTEHTNAEPYGAHNSADIDGEWIPELDDLVERLVTDTAAGWVHSGFQLEAHIGGQTVASVAYGRGHVNQMFTRDTLSDLYCTAKPITALGILKAVDDGELSLEDVVGDIIEGRQGNWILQRTVSEILSHTAGLHGLDEITARILPQNMRGEFVWNMPEPQGWKYGVDGTYSPFAGWWVLGEILESLYPETYDRYLTREITQRYGTGDNVIVRFDHDSFQAQHSRISASFDYTRQPRIPLLAEISERSACEWNPAFGSYGNAAGLVALYDGILGDLRGAGTAVSAELLEAAVTPRSSTYDTKLGRDASFGLGFMCDLEGHHFSKRVHNTSFGHAGQGGTSWAFCDPEHGLTVAAVFNGGADEDTALRWRRAALVASLYRDLGL